VRTAPLPRAVTFVHIFSLSLTHTATLALLLNTPTHHHAILCATTAGTMRGSACSHAGCCQCWQRRSLKVMLCWVRLSVQPVA
jgi:hypothetical protein